jgi:two-component system catabolic regulation response regulator CreB
MPRILLVEDEPAIADTLVYALKSECHEVAHTLTGEEALERHRAEGFDFVILDIGLPDISGLEVCRVIRRESATPILFLTARESELDRVLGLEIGGDDYVIKPFSPREVVARVRAILRRSQPEESAAEPPPAPAEPDGPPLVHDPSMMRILVADQPLELTAHEYKLLLVFIARPNRVFTRDQLLEHAWDDPGAVTDRTIDAHIKTIRSKLRDACGAGELIQTRRGLGYAYVPESWTSSR